MQDVRMDSHKLIYHPRRVADWLEGKLIYPIEVEIGLSGGCNHRCIFCAVDYMEYKPHLLKLDVLLPNLQIMERHGLKSVIYAGEGEPFTNPQIAEIVNGTKALGIDAALSTNGVFFSSEKIKSCLRSLTWVRYSVSAITDATYEKIHRCRQGDLQRVLCNMEEAVRVKRDESLPVTLGVQMLLLPDNRDEVVALAQTMKKIGLDYFTVKPFSQHPSAQAKLQVDYSTAGEIKQQLEELETENFKVYFRSQSIENLEVQKPYSECHGVNFMAYITADGDVYPCIAFMGRSDYIYGNINEQHFDDIWQSERADKIRGLFQDEFIHKYCRKSCRLDEINKYLHGLKHPGTHVNFI